MKNKNYIPKAIVALYCSLIILTAVYFVLITTLFDKWEIRGQFGDTFGALNALFTGITLITVVVTFYYQSKTNSENGITEKFNLYVARVQELRNTKIDSDVTNDILKSATSHITENDIGDFDDYMRINHYWFITYVKLVLATLDLLANLDGNESLRSAYLTAFKTYFSEDELKCTAIFSILSETKYAETLKQYIEDFQMLENVFIIGGNASDQVSEIDELLIDNFVINSTYDWI